jgi:hypothetical protein
MTQDEKTTRTTRETIGDKEMSNLEVQKDRLTLEKTHMIEETREKETMLENKDETGIVVIETIMIHLLETKRKREEIGLNQKVHQGLLKDSQKIVIRTDMIDEEKEMGEGRTRLTRKIKLN